MPQRWDAGGRGVRQEDEGGQRPTIEIPLEAHRDGLERKVKQNTETAARDGRCFGLTNGFSHRFGPWHRPLSYVPLFSIRLINQTRTHGLFSARQKTNVLAFHICENAVSQAVLYTGV